MVDVVIKRNLLRILRNMKRSVRINVLINVNISICQHPVHDLILNPLASDVNMLCNVYRRNCYVYSVSAWRDYE